MALLFFSSCVNSQIKASGILNRCARSACLAAFAVMPLTLANTAYAQAELATKTPTVELQSDAHSDQTSSASRQLSARLKSVKTFSANFEQNLFNRDGKLLQKTEGRTSLKQPGLFHWETQPPFEQVVIANNESLWVYDPDLEQVTVTPKEKMNSSPAHILTGDFSLLQGQYFVEQLKAVEPRDSATKTTTNAQTKETESYQMTSLKSGDTGFQKLSFSFDTSGALVLLELIDKLDQITRISFSDIEINQPMDSEIFNFVPPEGVDLISGN